MSTASHCQGCLVSDLPDGICPGCPSCAEKAQRIAELDRCMRQAGLGCFLSNGTPEQIATHMDRIAQSWIEGQEKDQEHIAALESATRRVVEAILNYRMQHDAIQDEQQEEDPECQCVDCDSGRAALANPVIVALRRE